MKARESDDHRLTNERLLSQRGLKVCHTAGSFLPAAKLMGRHHQELGLRERQGDLPSFIRALFNSRGTFSSRIEESTNEERNIVRWMPLSHSPLKTVAMWPEKMSHS